MKSFSPGVKRSRPLLGTFVEIRISAGEVEAGFAAIERVHWLMSAHEAQSDVSRIGRAAPGSCLQIDAWTYEVLSRAKALHLATDGLFDCAVAPVLMRSGLLPCHAPSVPEGSLDDLELLPGNLLRARRAVALTLDGIAKGYAVDRAVRALLDAGVAAGVVNAGGDLRLFGKRAEPVHVRDPRSPGRFIYIGELRNTAVASSAGPVVDPRSMTLRRTAQGVTVIAEDCATADALTKPCLIAPARASAIASRFAARALVVH